jgi:DNA-binding IclR family transcriptional regulator
MYPIASVDNALRLMTELGNRGAIRLSEASELIGCGRSTAHRLLAMLKHHGYAEQDPDTRLYRAGDGLLRFDRGPATAIVVQCARPVLEVIAGATGDTAHLCELRGGSTLFLDSVSHKNGGGTGSRLGVAYPAHCVSAGKALLAEVPRDLLPRLIGPDPLSTLTPASIGSRDALERNLRLVRARGYAINNEESQPGVFAVAVAVRTTSPTAPVALVLAAPTRRMPPERVEKVAELLRRASGALAHRIDAAISLTGELEALL